MDGWMDPLRAEIVVPCVLPCPFDGLLSLCPNDFTLCKSAVGCVSEERREGKCAKRCCRGN